MSDAPPRDRLGALLRTRRQQLSPQDVGIPTGSRRRTTGLRREEVARLADVSVTYYTFLEQGRATQPSEQVLDALARALRFSPIERRHLYTLARRPVVASAPEVIDPGVRALVARLDPCPTYVKGRRFDVLVANRSARALFRDWGGRPANSVRWMFTDPAARDVYVDWATEAAGQLARFRAAAAHHRDDPDFLDLIEVLHRDSAEVRAWWPRHEVAQVGAGRKRLRHPKLGEFILPFVVMCVADVPDQRLVTFGDEADLDRLAALSASFAENE
jgi:transcriptional regulator with XRE-family HTH domain